MAIQYQDRSFSQIMDMESAQTKFMAELYEGPILKANASEGPGMIFDEMVSQGQVNIVTRNPKRGRPIALHVGTMRELSERIDQEKERQSLDELQARLDHIETLLDKIPADKITSRYLVMPTKEEIACIENR